jgi:VNT family MFS transporter (synaptic vesicle glycoprotein 2)
MFFNHVNFTNCSFLDTEFSNTKSSKTQFLNSTLQSVSLIDSDLTKRHFIDCQISNLTVLRLKSSCDREFDYNFNIFAIWRANFASLLPSTVLILLMGEIVQRFGKSRTASEYIEVTNFTVQQPKNRIGLTMRVW